MSVRSRIYRERRLPAERPLAAIIAGWWRNGEQGVWYDASDLSTMYQDAAGTLPVYAPGRGQVDPPVGLLLDKRLGLRRGENVWQDSSVTLTGQASRVSAGVYRIYTPDGSISAVNHPVTAGRWYAVSFRVAAVAVASVGLYIGPSVANPVFASAYMVAGQTVSAVVCATGSVLSIARNASTTDVTIDSVVFRELKGNHAYQTTTTSRPTLSARYNLLTKSQDFSDAAVWVTQSSGTGSAPVRTKDYAAAPDGSMTATRLQMALNGGSTASDRSGVAQTVSGTTTGAGYGCAIWLKAASASSVGKTVLLRHMAGTNYLPCVLTAEWKAFGRVEAAGTTYGVVMLELRGASGGASDSVDMLVWGADLRPANDGVGLPPYQRVLDASTYDTAGFPLYLKFDGVDDFLQTASVDFSGTDKVFCAASFRKLSDATTGSLFELSAIIASNPGSFYITAPGAANTGNIKLATKGTTEVNVATTAAGYPSPISAIASAVMDIAAPISTLRINGVVAQSSSASLGSGSLGNYPLYIGRRGGATLPFNGRIYGLLIRGAATSNSTINNVERYLNQKAKVF